MISAQTFLSRIVSPTSPQAPTLHPSFSAGGKHRLINRYPAIVCESQHAPFRSIGLRRKPARCDEKGSLRKTARGGMHKGDDTGSLPLEQRGVGVKDNAGTHRQGLAPGTFLPWLVSAEKPSRFWSELQGERSGRENDIPSAVAEIEVFVLWRSPLCLEGQ